jgi:hypothetical protein
MTPARRGARLALALLVAAIAGLAFSPSASAVEEVEYALEIGESLYSTGFGEVACKYAIEGKTQEERPCEPPPFTNKKLVKLIPFAEPGSEFVRFENGEGSTKACNGLTGICEVKLEEEYSYVEARFDEITPAFSVHVVGEGEVSCMVEAFPQSCEEGDEFEFEAGILVEPEPLEGWEFAFFKNGTGSAVACSGQTKCSLTLEQDSTLEAVFVPSMHALTVTRGGTGTGTVTSEPLGIGCGPSCSAKFAEGTKITLKATPASGSTFAGWSGGGCSGTAPCVVTIEEAAIAVTATFAANPPPEDGAVSLASSAKVRGGRARVRLTCSGGFCHGTLKLSARLRRGSRPVVIGRTPFTLASGESAVIPVKLSAAAQRLVRKSGVLQARTSGSGVVAGPVKLRLATR